MTKRTTLEGPGCPPLRALVGDSLGFIKVIEARSKQGGAPNLVQRWGDPDPSRGVLATAISNNQSDPLLAIARKNCLIEVLNPTDGELCFSVSNDDISAPINETIAGLHLFDKQKVSPSSRCCGILTITSTGRLSLKTVDYQSGINPSVTAEDSRVCSSGEICCSKVHDNSNHFVCGGKGVELIMWDLEKGSKTWSSKSPRKDSLGIFNPTWFTSVTFLNKDDHQKIVAGTDNSEVRLYDVSEKRRPVLSVKFKDTPIKAVAEDLDGHTIYAGNGSGDLASIDIRTGRVLGCFAGKCSGSIRSIARHPELSVIASCGLDGFLRFWDVESRQQLSAVYLKQRLTSVVFDSCFDEDKAVTAVEEPVGGLQDTEELQVESADDVELPAKRKKDPEDAKNGLKKKSKKTKNKSVIVNGD